MAGEDLGGDFTLGAAPGASDAESVTTSAGKHLYYKGNDLGQVGYVSVAPSGHFAIFERDREIFLIESGPGHLNPVTDETFTMPKNVRWFEDQGFAEVEYAGVRPSSRIPLR